MPLALLLSLAGVVSAAPPKQVSFQTSDGWTIHATYTPPKRGGLVMVLVHGVAASRHEWDGFCARLSAQGVGSLSIDLRGHNESTEGPKGERDHQDFDVSGEWTKAVLDLKAAASWLEARGIEPRRIAFGGASIGANLASQVAAERALTPGLLLLSPGPDYRGVRLMVRPGLKTLVAASPADRYAYQTLDPLSKVAGTEVLSTSGGHGAQVFGDPKTFDRIVAWVVSTAARK